MTTLLHLSDLHFGPAYLPRLGELILRDIDALVPDVVIISGDFTMRARVNEFEQARAFLLSIRVPTLVIPGNHDQPLLPVAERLRTPYARYQQFIHPTVDAVLGRDGFFVIGLNDNRPILPGGFWSRAQRAWMENQWSRATTDAIKIIATHHQIDWGGKMRPFGFWRAEKALQFLARGGVEIVLNGHTHVPSAVQSREGIVIVRAGTVTSSRTRHGNRNAYNVIRIEAKTIHVQVREHDANTKAFVDAREFEFARRNR